WRGMKNRFAWRGDVESSTSFATDRTDATPPRRSRAGSAAVSVPDRAPAMAAVGRAVPARARGPWPGSVRVARPGVRAELQAGGRGAGAGGVQRECTGRQPAPVG